MPYRFTSNLPVCLGLLVLALFAAAVAWRKLILRGHLRARQVWKHGQAELRGGFHRRVAVLQLLQELRLGYLLIHPHALLVQAFAGDHASNAAADARVLILPIVCRRQAWGVLAGRGGPAG